MKTASLFLLTLFAAISLLTSVVDGRDGVALRGRDLSVASPSEELVEVNESDKKEEELFVDTRHRRLSKSKSKSKSKKSGSKSKSKSMKSGGKGGSKSKSKSKKSEKSKGKGGSKSKSKKSEKSKGGSKSKSKSKKSEKSKGGSKSKSKSKKSGSKSKSKSKKSGSKSKSKSKKSGSKSKSKSKKSGSKSKSAKRLAVLAGEGTQMDQLSFLASGTYIDPSTLYNMDPAADTTDTNAGTVTNLDNLAALEALVIPKEEPAQKPIVPLVPAMDEAPLVRPSVATTGTITMNLVQEQQPAHDGGMMTTPEKSMARLAMLESF